MSCGGAIKSKEDFMARKKLKCKTFMLPDGTRKYIYGKTQKEVEEKYIQARLEMNAGVT